MDPVVLNVPNAAVIPDSAVLTHGSATVTAGAETAGDAAAADGAAADGAAAGDGSPPAHPAIPMTQAVVITRSGPRSGRAETSMRDPSDSVCGSGRTTTPWPAKRAAAHRTGMGDPVRRASRDSDPGVRAC
ncbi:hypothetical protein GCM10009610_56180 [Pseudonocardia xinjiangensis]